ncbi:MAG: hypothetical protein R2940_04225 [Syntrophotaleaceae bacterium]
MKFTLNMASRRYINRRLLYRFYLAVILVLSVLLIILFFNGLRLAGYASQFREHLENLQHQGSGNGEAGKEPPSAAELIRLRTELDFARTVLRQDNFRWTSLLNRLEDIAVEGIRVQTIEPDYRSGALTLSALARDHQIFQDFLNNLLTAGQFTDVYLLEQDRIQIRDADNQTRTAVSFRVELKGAF